MESFLRVLVLVLACTAGAETGRRSDEKDWGDVLPTFAKSRSNAQGERILSAMSSIQREKLGHTQLSKKRVLVCKTFGGMGNRIQGITSCLAFALATNRALVLDWHLEYEDINGLMPCRIQDLFELPPDLSMNVSILHNQHSEEEVQRSTMEVYRSEVKMGSGQTPNWAELLLCRNLSHALEPVPVLLLPSFRWMPETIANHHYKERLRAVMEADDASFYRLVAPAFFQPTPRVALAVRELSRYWPAGAGRMGMHLRVGQHTDDPRQIGHFFSPSSLWPAWVTCGYAAMPPAWRAGSARTVWFLASDSHAAKGRVLRQLQREEGAIVRGLNLEAVLGEEAAALPGGIARVDSLRQDWPGLHPVVAEFASGSRLVTLAQGTTREACGNLQGALVEMELLARSHLLVASHLSTFATFPAASLDPAAVHVVTRDGDCFPAATADPLSDAGDLYGDSSRPSCYSDKAHFELSWGRPRHLSVRGAPT